jgi:hypothetical protein
VGNHPVPPLPPGPLQPSLTTGFVRSPAQRDPGSRPLGLASGATRSSMWRSQGESVWAGMHGMLARRTRDMGTLAAVPPPSGARLDSRSALLYARTRRWKQTRRGDEYE